MFRPLRVLGILGILSLPLVLNAQTTWWGMTASGGVSGIGSIYTITESSTFTKKHDFFRFEGGSPKGDVTKATNGLYYGVTEFGGSAGVGVLYSFNPATSAYTVLVNFSTSVTGISAIGARPYRGLIQAVNGRLYGTCQEGGVNNQGTLFDFNIATGLLTKRADFDALATAASKGRAPRCRLMQASNALIYGVTQLGGLNGRGTLFQFNTSTNVFTKRHDFAALPSLTGGQPFSGLAQAANGLLYGTTQIGGLNGGGVIYSFNTTTNVYTSVYDFTQATGRFPLAEPVLASNGSLYGTTSAGGVNNLGVIYSYDPVTDIYTDRFNLVSGTGSSPFARMIVGSNGLLYGTANQGGPSNAGVVFSFNITTNSYNAVYDLSAGGFSDPWAGVIEDPVGTLVGVANSSGTGGQGAVYSVVIGSGVDTELVPFSFSNGSTPKGRLLKATNGSFYGVTSLGGTDNTGILFSYNPTTNTFARLVNFSATLGQYPLGTLVESAGKLYGVCSGGGTASGGTLFEYTIATNTCVKKKDLALLNAGTVPQNGLFKAGNGKLYGNTSVGGVNGQGAIFDYVPSTNTLAKLVDFTVAGGSQPLGDLIQASNGLLYGTCSANGQFNKGSLYALNTGTNTFTLLYSFDGIQGGVPCGDVVQASNGKLYGTFREDGQGFSGGIFSWDIGTSLYTEEYSFNIPPIITEGKLSESNLIQGTDGLLYGTTAQGGTTDQGSLFRFNPTTLALGILQSFAGSTNGQYPFDGLASEIAPTTNNSVSVNAKVFLEGPYNTVSGTMNTDLRTLTGVNGFPTTEPFTAAGFTIVGGGGETIAPAVLSTTGANAVVDWVLLELRDKNTPTNILRTKALLLQSDGDIVDTDNSSIPSFPLAADNYFVALRQRNHFGVMTSTALALTASPTVVNFTSPTQATFGTNAQKTIGAVQACWAGNVLRNTVVQYIGANNDRDPILVRVGSTIPTNVVSGYYAEDVNLNGTVQYVGAGNDRDPILVNVGGTTPNNTITEQLP
jgi:uncharacterized repeat protein (TIGR03803 family)